MRFLEKIKKPVVFLSVIVMLMLTFTDAVMAGDEPYDTYNYDYREDVVPTPSA